MWITYPIAIPFMFPWQGNPNVVLNILDPPFAPGGELG